MEAPGATLQDGIAQQADFVAELVRQRMLARLSQAALGALMGYDRTYVNKIERGALEPTAEFARKADASLHLSGDLFERWESFNDSALGWSYLVSVAQAYGFGGQLFDDVDWSALDDDKAANTRPVAGLLPDEAVIADQFVNAHAQKRWITVKRDAKPEWYKSVNGLWERDDLTIEYDVSQRCREVAKILRRGPFASATEAKAANTRAQALNGAVMAQHVARLVRNDPRMHVEASQLDEHAWLLGYEGGYVARDGTLMPPDASLYFTKHLRSHPTIRRPARSSTRCSAI